MTLGNKNFKEERRFILERAIEEGHSERTVNRRYRGTTTAIALETIANAVRNPGTPVKIRDHHCTVESDKHLMYVIQVVLNNLGLVGFIIKTNGRTLTYTLDYVYEGWRD